MTATDKEHLSYQSVGAVLGRWKGVTLFKSLITWCTVCTLVCTRLIYAFPHTVLHMSPTSYTRILDFSTWTFFLSSFLSVKAFFDQVARKKCNVFLWRDSLWFAGINTFTSFLAGFVIFSILGFMAHRQNIRVSDVAESGETAWWHFMM